jgi:nucleoid-associated protein YgaU
MPNDAKLGLVVGVGVVIAIAVVFFRKDVGGLVPVLDGPAAASVTAPKAATAGNPETSNRPVKGKPTAQPTSQERVAKPAVRRHVVKEGETLFSLAELYYGDGEKSPTILEANKEVVKSPDELAPGTDLVIP